MDVKILDRIVNVRCGYTVPFGLKGTVISIQDSLTTLHYFNCDRDTMYEVIFDSPFQDGMKLNCSTGRGYKLPKYSFINISYGKRLMEQKTGKPGNICFKQGLFIFVYMCVFVFIFVYLCFSSSFNNILSLAIAS